MTRTGMNGGDAVETASMLDVDSRAGNRPFVVVTDLDDTVLGRDHDTEALAATLVILRRRGIPVWACTHKSWSEMAAMSELAWTGTFVEGGAAVIEASADMAAWGRPRSELLVVLDQLRAMVDCDLPGYHQMSDEAVAELTGLPLARARLARQREFSESFVTPSRVVHEEVTAAAARLGARVHRGGRLSLLTGAHDKGAAIDWLRARDPVGFVVALGDAPADLPMLLGADLAIVVGSGLSAAPLPRESTLRVRSPDQALELLVRLTSRREA